MGIIKRAGDLVYTFRFLRLLTTKFEDTKAYELGIIDADGKRLKSYNTDTVSSRDDLANYYTPFHRLVFNIKKIMAKAPGGGSRLASYAAALYLLKEKFSISDKTIKDALVEYDIDPLDFINESTQWFVLEDKKLSPGVYKIYSSKLNTSKLDEVALPRDNVKVFNDCYPVGEIFGLDIYEVTHVKTQQPVYVAVGELTR
jgi:hypothetical protein